MLVRPQQMKPDTRAVSDPAVKPTPGDLQIVQKLAKSELYQRFRAAYGDLTGLPLALRSKDYWQPPFAWRNAGTIDLLLHGPEPKCLLLLPRNTIETYGVGRGSRSSDKMPDGNDRYRCACPREW